MDAVIVSVQSKHDCGADINPGEAYLSAMKKQLVDMETHKDDRYLYKKADGIIKMSTIRDRTLIGRDIRALQQHGQD